MSQPQPSFVRDEGVDPTNDNAYLSSTNEPHTCKDSSDSSSSSSSSPYPSNMKQDSSVLLQGLHDCYPQHHHHHHVTTHLFQNLSLQDNKNPDTCKPMTRRKLPLSRLSLSSARSDTKHENKIKKSIIKKKRTPTKFRYYRHPGAMAAITSAMEALNPHGDDAKGTAPVSGLDHSLVIRLKYKTSSATSTIEEQAVESSVIQLQVRRKPDIMRIDSILNENSTPSMSSPPPSFDSSVVASNDDASQSSPQAPSLNMPDHYIERTSTDILDHMLDHDHDTANAQNQLAKAGLRDEYIEMLTHPERQRYEDALVEIVGDLELPFFGGRFGSGG